MFNFPDAPIEGQTITLPDGSSRMWDGTKWRAASSGGNDTGGGDLFLLLSGGVMDGPITLAGDATQPLHPVSYQQVQPFLFNGPYVQEDGGDPMTGLLTLSGNATQPLHAVPLQQLNAATAGGPFLPLASGGTVSGNTTFQANLTAVGLLTSQVSGTIGTNAGAQSILRFVTAAGSNKDILWLSDGAGAANTRFRLRHNTDLTLDAFDDAGVALGTMLTLGRLAKRGTFSNTLEAKSLYSNPGTVTWPGATPPYNPDQITLFSNTSSMTGVMPGGIYAANYFLINSDTADATNLDGSAGIRLIYKYGGPGTKGGRHGIRSEVSQTGPHDLDQRIMAAYFINDFSYPAPGNATMWGINPYVRGHAGATGYGVINGIEVDVTMEAGSSMQNRCGITVNSSGVTDAVQGSVEDCGYALRRNVGNAYPGWKIGFQFGGIGNAFPIDPTIGRMISVLPMTTYSAGNPVTQYPPLVCDIGIDVFPVQFNTAALRYRGGLIDGAGSVIVGNASISQTAGGAAIDLNYQRVTAAAIVGTFTGLRCFVNDKVWGTNGTVLTVTAVDGSNRATAVAIDTPGRSLSPPANPQTFNGQNAQGLSINLTWAASNTLALQPSGGATVFGGLVTLAGNATLPLHAVPLQQLNAAVAGGPFLPLIGGAVTGPTTFTAAGTGLAVTNNATVGGTLAVAGAATLPAITGPTAITGSLTAPRSYFDLGTGPLDPGIIANPRAVTISNADGQSPGINIVGFGTSTVQNIIAGYSAGGSRAAPSGSPNAQVLLSLIGVGYGTTAYSGGARGLITIQASEAWSDTAQGAHIKFNTTPVGGIATAEAVRILNSGNVAIGTIADSGDKLNVNGSAKIVGGMITGPPNTQTGTAYTIAASDYTIIFNPSGTFTLTFPAAVAAQNGRILYFKLIANFAVNSANANIVPLAGGTPAAAIMPATAGKFCVVQCDGTRWQIIAAN